MPTTVPPLLEAVIIGAGPAGLSASKELLAACPDLRNQEVEKEHDGKQQPPHGRRTSRRIVVLEESNAVGGMWYQSGEAYRIDDGSSGSGRNNHNSYISDPDDGDGSTFVKIPVATSSQPLYDDLVANIPKHIMCFRDTPYPHGVPILPRPHHVQAYFEHYATVQNLRPYIRFQSRVVQCIKVTSGGSNDGKSPYWEITALEGQHGEEGKKRTKKALYRSKRLVVCTGHHRKPYVPACIRGVRHYRCEILHSSAFRSPKQFVEGSTVLIVGGGISGADIAKTLLRSAGQEGSRKKVLVSVRQWRSWPHGLLLRKLKKEGLVRPGISHIDKDGTVHFDAASCANNTDQCALPVKPDVIILATGYRYDYPFLPKDGGFIQQDGFKMRRLYLRMLYADDPSLVFLQIPTMTLSPIMLIEYQSRWYAQYVQGKLNVSDESMEAEILSRKEDLTADNLRIVAGFVPYCNSLAKMTGDHTFWVHMLSIRFPMMIQSVWFAMKQSLSLRFFGKKQKEN